MEIWILILEEVSIQDLIRTQEAVRDDANLCTGIKEESTRLLARMIKSSYDSGVRPRFLCRKGSCSSKSCVEKGLGPDFGTF